MRSSAGMRWHANLLLSGTLMMVAGLPAAAAEGGPRFIGPLATPGMPLPAGVTNIEPYLVATRSTEVFDGRGDRHRVGGPDGWSMSLPMQYGLTDWLTLGLTVRGSFDRSLDGGKRDLDLGDSTVSAQFAVYDSDGPHRTRVAVAVRQNVASGRYNQLDPAKHRGSGSGTAPTTLALHSQWYALDGRMRMRAFSSWRLPGSSADLQDRSVYGTELGFRGRARQGAGWMSSSSLEYSLNPRWTLVGEVMYERDSGTTLRGTQADGTPLWQRDARSWRASVLPAVEYHFNDAVGMIVGAQVAVAGRNTAAVVAPQVAVNIAF